MIEEIKVRSFSHFISLIEDDTEFDLDNKLVGVTIYRGQNCDKPLLPKIGRHKKSANELLDIEDLMFEEFAKRCQPFLGFEPENDWDYLATAQHFGLPTRLLDWTENPLVALWFVVSNGTIEGDEGVLWVFDVDEENLVVDFEVDPFEIKGTKVFDPYHFNRRITSQSGWFSVHQLKENSKKSFVPLELNKRYSEQLRKIKVPNNFFEEFRLKLNKMGINKATIFSDLDGLCAHLNWKYFNK